MRRGEDRESRRDEALTAGAERPESARRRRADVHNTAWDGAESGPADPLGEVLTDLSFPN